MSALDRYRPLAGSSASRWSRALSVPVPVELVLAVMRRENPRGDTTAVTHEPDGHYSYGLMQVKDSTATRYGVLDPRMLLNPAVGIDVGTRYLAEQLKRYKGNIPAAIAAYNAGTAHFTEQETFRNQPYVDAVLKFYRGLAAGARQVGPAGLVLGTVLLIWIFRDRHSHASSRSSKASW
jgi:soluble lytic murein transglycosylase-like protein